jgi:monovalent cation:proton antiporter-2 (CPA2) family protein
MSPIFLNAFVYLLCAVIAVPIAKRLGLSSVLGYLVAGMAIGRFGLGLIGEEGESVMHFAEFGVVMMLFLIGLELQPSLLWRMRFPILGLGGGQMFLTAAAILIVGLLLGLTWQVAIAVGLALALSSTAIVLQSLQEKGLSGTTGGKSAFSVLLFQDIAVIPILATFPLLATLTPVSGDGHSHGDSTPFQEWLSHQPGWINTLLVLGAVVSIIILGRFVARPALRMVAKTRVREAFVALALVLVVGIALLMNSLGVSAALGTFLAGVVLADSEYRHELEADIEPFKGLLLGVFFISVGASIDFSLIMAQPAVIAGIVLGLMILKAIVLLGLGYFWKLKMDQRFLFSLSLAQGSEFAFVLLGFGVAEGVFSVDLSQLLIAGVALSMALTPLVMILEEKVLRKRFGTQESVNREADHIEESAPVILAGMGRFGNFVARALRSQGIVATVIDNDSDHIDLIRRLGMKAYYGDATRHDLLESAGAAHAKLLIIAIDEEERINDLIETARKHFPNLEIITRAISMNHQFELIEKKVEFAVHQNSGSALQLAENAMVRLGFRAHKANRAVRAFAKSERQRAHSLASIHRDEKAFISTVREQVSEMERQFELDSNNPTEDVDKAWDPGKFRDQSQDQ